MDERRVVVIGAGRGGSRAVAAIAGSVDDGPETVAVDTDTEALGDLAVTRKLQIGARAAGGLGAGGDSSIGRSAAEESADEIASLFDGVDLAIIVVGLGGGAGTGAAPVLLDSAREAGAMSVCFATLPFDFEGQRRQQDARKAAAGLRALTDSLILIPNQRLFSAVGESTVVASFEKADELLCGGVCAIWRLVARPGYISIGVGELHRILSGGGTCSFAHGCWKGVDRAGCAVRSALESSLLEGGEAVARAYSVLVSVAGGADLTLNEVSEIMKEVSTRATESAAVNVGTIIDDTMKGTVSVTILVSEGKPAAPDERPPKTKPPTGRRTSPARRGRGKRGKRDLQAKLSLESSARGRFKDVEPTVLDGEDLDIPTFIRRGLRVER